MKRSLICTNQAHQIIDTNPTNSFSIRFLRLKLLAIRAFIARKLYYAWCNILCNKAVVNFLGRPGGGDIILM